MFTLLVMFLTSFFSFFGFLLRHRLKYLYFPAKVIILFSFIFSIQLTGFFYLEDMKAIGFKIPFLATTIFLWFAVILRVSVRALIYFKNRVSGL